MIFRVLLAAVGGLSLVLAGCGSDEFNQVKVKTIVEGTPLKLDAEYVILTPQQVDCGVKDELWEAPAASGSAISTARLTQKGRDLKFGDDVTIGEQARPFVQIRGDFNAIALNVQSDKDGPEKDTKLVEAKLGVVIQHSCFPNPLPLMGVKKGKFTQDSPSVLLFRNDNGWQIEKLMH